MAQPLGFVFTLPSSHSYPFLLLPLSHSASLFKRFSLRSAFSIPINQGHWHGLLTFFLDTGTKEFRDST
jgi:hypothetical protein